MGYAHIEEYIDSPRERYLILTCIRHTTIEIKSVHSDIRVENPSHDGDLVIAGSYHYLSRNYTHILVLQIDAMGSLLYYYRQFLDDFALSEIFLTSTTIGPSLENAT